MNLETEGAEKIDRYRVQSVARALELISIISDHPQDGMSLTELSKALRVSKSTTLSLVRTLVGYGYLSDAEPGPRYFLGTTLIRLGDIASRELPLGAICRPLLEELAAETKMTSRVAINDGGYPIFIERVDGPGSVRFYTPLGQREVPYASAAGKAILSTLAEDEVRAICLKTGLAPRTSHTITEINSLLDNLALSRRRGFAVDDEEDAEGVFCTAAGFFNHTGECVGAISVTGIKGDLPVWRVDELGRCVRSSADRLSALLGGSAYTSQSTQRGEQ